MKQVRQADGGGNIGPVFAFVEANPVSVKYSISDKCRLIVFKSDQDTTAAEAIHKEAHILFLRLVLFCRNGTSFS